MKRTFQVVPNPVEVSLYQAGHLVEIKGLGVHLLFSLNKKYSLTEIQKVVKRLIEEGRLAMAPKCMQSMLNHPEI